MTNAEFILGPENGRHGFGTVIDALAGGYAAQRAGWNGKGQYLRIQRPIAGSEMTRAYIYIVTVDGERVPWLASQADVLARDWLIGTVEERAIGRWIRRTNRLRASCRGEQ